jgi:hypothetical protein
MVPRRKDAEMRLISSAPSATLRRIGKAAGAFRASRCAVEGIVYAQDDLMPLAHALVQAFGKDQLRREMSLGEAWTDGEGRFQLTFPDSEFRRRDRSRPHLVFRVFTSEGRLIQEANVQLPANRTAPVNLVVRIPRRPPDKTTTPVSDLRTAILQGAVAVAVSATLVWTSIRALAGVRRTEDDIS